MDRTQFLHDIQKIAHEIHKAKEDFDKDMARICHAFDELVRNYEKGDAGRKD